MNISCQEYVDDVVALAGAPTPEQIAIIRGLLGPPVCRPDPRRPRPARPRK